MQNASGEITRKLVRESIYIYDPVTMEVYRCDTRSEDWCKVRSRLGPSPNPRTQEELRRPSN